jgi:hypothetical protein
MRKYILLIIIIASFTHGCSTNPDERTSPNPTPTTTQEKPILQGQTPLKFDIGTEQPTYIRVISNSDRLKKVWMVYYDSDQQKWEQTLIGKGSGENNKIIGDTKFDKRYGFNKYYENPPEFYLTFSDDNGQTWKSYQIERAILNCDAKGKDTKINWDAQLLISSALNVQSGLPEA